MLVVPLFVLTPRFEVIEWDPLARFGVKNAKEAASTGFSEEIDLRREGRLEPDTSQAFVVRVTDRDGVPVRYAARRSALAGRGAGPLRERGLESRERAELAEGAPAQRQHRRAVIPIDDGIIMRFRVPRRLGTLLLAEPVILGPERGMLPVVMEDTMKPQRVPLFFEACGTVVSVAYLTEPEYRYIQMIPQGASSRALPCRADARPMGTFAQRLRGEAPGLQHTVPQTVVAPAATTAGAEQYPGDERFHAALDRQSERGSFLPPAYWERVAHMLTGHLSRSGEYAYSLERRRQDRQLDPVEDFLYNVKQGPCEHYASALTLLLRSRGIPARIVKGFRGAEYQGEGTYIVRNNQAHAWIEAQVPAEKGGPEYEWLILDPSPPDAQPSTSAPGALAVERPGVVARPDHGLYRRRPGGPLAGSDPRPAGRRTAAVAGPGTARAWGSGGWYSADDGAAPPKATGRAGSMYSRLLELLDRHARLRPRPEETPSELARRAAAYLAGRAATRVLAEVPAEVVAVWYTMRYGGRRPEEPVMRETASRLDALAAALRRG